MGALSLILKFASDVINDKTLQHFVALGGVGYVVAHSFSAAFRHDVTVADSKVKSFFRKLALPFVRTVAAFRDAGSGFKAGLKGDAVTITLPPAPVSIPAVSAAPAASAQATPLQNHH